jgi:hypothetical protein
VRIDSRVEPRKFEAEVALLRRHGDRLVKMGVHLTRVRQPEIDFVFIADKPLQIALATPRLRLDPATMIATQEFVPAGGAIVTPFSSWAFGVRLDLSGYDQRAPSVSFRSARTWEPLPFAALPLGHVTDGAVKMRVLIQEHPATKHPFLCIRGVREYHEHPQHDGDHWAMYRSDINVYALVEKIAHIMLESVAPQPLLLIQPSWAVISPVQ